MKLYTDSPLTVKKESKAPSNIKTSNFQVIEVTSCENKENKENIDVNLNRQLDKEFDTPEKIEESTTCKDKSKNQ